MGTGMLFCGFLLFSSTFEEYLEVFYSPLPSPSHPLSFMLIREGAVGEDYPCFSSIDLIRLDFSI